VVEEASAGSFLVGSRHDGRWKMDGARGWCTVLKCETF
jgi:hypothetical protein